MASKNDPPEIDGPPLKTNKDLPKKSEEWKDVELPIDILLLTVKDCEFLSCLSFLNGFFRSYHDKLGKVYFSKIGDERMLLKIALIKCDKGSTGPGGSTVVVKNAVEVLGPKAVFCVGFYAGLNREKVRLGDVVVSAKLITYAATKVLEDGIQERGVRVPVTERIAKLIRGIADGWEAPLKDPEKLKVNVHRDGVFLSGPELVDNSDRRKELVNRFPEAIAIEMEGEAHDVEVPWIIIKGVSDFADGKKSDTNSWRPFASAMAASVVANVLNDSIVFKNWRHYGNEYAEPTAATKRKSASNVSVLT
ncbi:hypothetical protein ACROYT_G016328 [Oculina patagonica]